MTAHPSIIEHRPERFTAAVRAGCDASDVKGGDKCIYPKCGCDHHLIIRAAIEAWERFE